MGRDTAKLLEGESVSGTFQSKLLTRRSPISMENVCDNFCTHIQIWLPFCIGIYNLNQVRKPYS